MGNKLEKAADHIIDKKSQQWADQTYNPSMLQTFPNMNETQLRDYIKLFGAHAISHKDAKMNEEDFRMLLKHGSNATLNHDFGKKDFRDIPGALLRPLQEGIIFKLFFGGYFWDNEDKVIERLFQAMDTTGDKKIELFEFLYLVNLLFGKDKELFEIIFRAANLSHTTKLTKQEATSLKLALESIPCQEGETLTEFVEKANNPEYVNAIKTKLKLQIQPDQLAICSILGKFIYVTFDDNNSLDDLKSKIQDKEGIPPNQQHLYYNGEEIKDPLSSYGFVLGQIEKPVYLKLSLR